MLPSWIGTAFEMVEAEFGLELLILLFDRPALMRESDQLLDRRGGGQVDEKVFRARCRAEILFAQKPDLGSQPSIAPVVCRSDAHGGEPGRPRAIRPVAPRHPSPRAHRQGQRQRADGDRTRVVTSTSCDRGRPMRPLGGTWTAGVPGNTVR